MKSSRKYLIIVFALTLLLSMTITVHGASVGKTTYLVTKDKYYEYEADQKTIKEKSIITYKYDKNGLLKSITYSPDSSGFSSKETLVYNSKKQAIKTYTVEYYKGKKINKHCKKSTYNKNGYVSKVKLYWIDDGKYKFFGDTRLTWNKKGKLTKVRECDADGKTETTDWYTYNKKGQLIKSRHYDASDKTKSTTWYKYNKDGKLIKEYYNNSPGCTEWTYDGNTATVTEYEDKANNMLAYITYETYEHGDVVKEVRYGGKDGTYAGEEANYKVSTGSRVYKKFTLSSKYRKLVRKQQACLYYITF